MPAQDLWFSILTAQVETGETVWPSSAQHKFFFLRAASCPIWCLLCLLRNFPTSLISCFPPYIFLYWIPTFPPYSRTKSLTYSLRLLSFRHPLHALQRCLQRKIQSAESWHHPIIQFMHRNCWVHSTRWGLLRYDPAWISSVPLKAVADSLSCIISFITALCTHQGDTDSSRTEPMPHQHHSFPSHLLLSHLFISVIVFHRLLCAIWLPSTSPLSLTKQTARTTSRDCTKSQKLSRATWIKSSTWTSTPSSRSVVH